MKIRFTKCTYKRNESDTTCPICRTEEGNTEHIIVCQVGNNTYNSIIYWVKMKRNGEKLLQFT